jgi:hypothetical protein
MLRAAQHDHQPDPNLRETAFGRSFYLHRAWLIFVLYLTPLHLVATTAVAAAVGREASSESEL